MQLLYHNILKLGQYFVCFCNTLNISTFGDYYVFKVLIEQYLEKQGEMDLTHNGYGEDDMLKDLSEKRLNIKYRLS